MSDIRSKLYEVYSLEDLSEKNTFIHRLHPISKMLVTIVYIFCVIMHGRYELFSIIPYIFYPIIVMSLAEIPCKMILKRTMIALPFTLFAGISNLIFDRHTFVVTENIIVTTGFVSFFVIIFRTVLCVSAVLILIATTRFSILTNQLRNMHIPNILVSLLEMIYRYLSVLLEEAHIIVTAYRLRNTNAKWPKVKDFGPFVGQLFIRSIDRSERIYAAMKCRGYGSTGWSLQKHKLKPADYIYIMIWCISSLIFILI